MTRSNHRTDQLSLWLTLGAICAGVILLVTVLLVATRMAHQFDKAARIDAEQRVQGSLAQLFADMQDAVLSHAEWTAAYQAVQTRDLGWLAENVGASAYVGGRAHLIIVGGDPLQGIHGWAARDVIDPDQAQIETVYRFASAIAQTHAMAPDDGPLSTFLRIGDDVWLIAMDWVTPHTQDMPLTLPTALLVFGTSMGQVLPQYFGNTRLLSQTQIEFSPGVAGGTLALTGPDGPVAWINWTLPSPGTDAMRAAALPVGAALALVLLALALGTVVIRRLAFRLEHALRDAQIASQSKSAFLSTMSHEIRTPLNGVLGMADLLADTDLDTRQRAMVSTIRTSGWGLLDLLNDILDLTKVEAGKLHIDTRPFDLSALIDRISALHAPNARAKGVLFDLDLPAGGVTWRQGDETRIAQILHNLVGNAVKFTQQGQITLGVQWDDPDRVCIVVRDTGIGMTDEQVGRIFKPFEQADEGTARRFGGSGLGMAIVHKLVGMMAGDIQVHSQPGLGTVVTVQLAMPAAPARDVAAASDLAADVAPDAARDLAPDLPPQIQAAPSILRDRKVLVAEDNATNRLILSTMLARLGIDARFAMDGAEACAAWRRDDYDILVLDIAMPVMDGVEALRQIRAEAALSGRPVPVAIAATANVMAEQVARYKAEGFFDILPKPARRQDMEAVFLRALSA